MIRTACGKASAACSVFVVLGCLGGLIEPCLAEPDDLPAATGETNSATSDAAQATDDTQAIEQARRALADGANPWYDRETDALRAMEFDAQRSDKPSKRSNSNWDLGYFLQLVAWGAIGVALAAIVGFLVWFALNQRQNSSRKVASQPDLLTEADQVEALPFLADRPRDDLLGHARRHYEAGNYSEAIIYLFSYQLLALDKVSRIHLARGKTNRQYLREVPREGPLRGLLERSLVTFESVFFGRRPLDRASFEACWLELPNFEQELRAPV